VDGPNSVDSARASRACDRLGELRELPFKGEPVSDAVYNELIAVGHPAIPCLVDKIDDATPMPDPRKAPPIPGGVAVGDVALFVLSDVSSVDFKDLLPPEVLKEWPEQGVYAYFAYVRNTKNRAALKRYVESLDLP
jgi:hypothetical protein